MNRKQYIVLVAALLAASSAFAGSRAREMSPTPAPVAQESQADKVQIKGNTTMNAKSHNSNAVAVGEGNNARNTAGAIRGGTQIQGNTRINAASNNANAIAVGRGNNAANQAGVIGGN